MLTSQQTPLLQDNILYPNALYAQVEQELDQLEKLGIIEKTNIIRFGSSAVAT